MIFKQPRKVSAVFVQTIQKTTYIFYLCYFLIAYIINIRFLNLLIRGRVC